MAETRIGVIGCAGRVGRMLIADIVGAEGCALAGGVARPGSAAFGTDIGELAGLGRVGIAVGDTPEPLLRDSDVAIEFTTPAATAEHAALAARLGKPLVIGTTGLEGAEERAVREAATRVPIVWAANTSLGINLLFGLVDQVFFFQAEDGIRDRDVTGVQTCALPISPASRVVSRKPPAASSAASGA